MLASRSIIFDYSLTSWSNVFSSILETTPKKIQVTLDDSKHLQQENIKKEINA
jgi:hypothetical protein